MTIRTISIMMIPGSPQARLQNMMIWRVTEKDQKGINHSNSSGLKHSLATAILCWDPSNMEPPQTGWKLAHLCWGQPPFPGHKYHQNGHLFCTRYLLPLSIDKGRRTTQHLCREPSGFQDNLRIERLPIHSLMFVPKILECRVTSCL